MLVRCVHLPVLLSFEMGLCRFMYWHSVYIWLISVCMYLIQTVQCKVLTWLIYNIHNLVPFASCSSISGWAYSQKHQHSARCLTSPAYGSLSFYYLLCTHCFHPLLSHPHTPPDRSVSCLLWIFPGKCYIYRDKSMSYGFGKTSSPDMSNAMSEQCYCRTKDVHELQQHHKFPTGDLQWYNRKEKHLVLIYLEMTGLVLMTNWLLN